MTTLKTKHEQKLFLGFLEANNQGEDGEKINWEWKKNKWISGLVGVWLEKQNRRQGHKYKLEKGVLGEKDSKK